MQKSFMFNLAVSIANTVLYRLVTPAVNNRSRTGVLMLTLVQNVPGYRQENFKCATVTNRALKGNSEKWKKRENK
jgi:hypothetical protein